MENLREVTMALFHEVDGLKEAQDDLKSKVEALEARTRELEIPSLTGQLAVKVEKELVKRILDNTGVDLQSTKTTNVTLHMMNEALQNPVSLMGGGIFASDEQKRKARDNWIDLNHSLGLNFETYSAINELKLTQNLKAHPDLTLEKLSSRLRREVKLDFLLERSEKLIQVLKGLGVYRIKA
uniref:Uncharacterized protein n=1 Tax=Amphimedon queenslandica TaxID=400682 RepID=A0A1X7VMK3_AMPQE